jgi:hypothetical protein
LRVPRLSIQSSRLSLSGPSHTPCDHFSSCRFRRNTVPLSLGASASSADNSWFCYSVR